MADDKKSLVTFTDDNFEEEVEKTEDTIVIVDFWAPWCGPCQIMTSILEEIAEDYKSKDKVVVGKMNVDENDQMSEKYMVRSIPTTKLFLNGEVIDESVGAVPKETLTEKIDEAVKKIKK